MAPSMREIEEQFKNQINFVVVDGSAEKNYDLVSTLTGYSDRACVFGKTEKGTAALRTAPQVLSAPWSISN